jgi:excinuclease UvrABC helicase subunit UvrB
MASKYDQFKLVTDFELRGPGARHRRAGRGLNAATGRGASRVTGSGKTFTMAQCVAR